MNAVDLILFIRLQSLVGTNVVLDILGVFAAKYLIISVVLMAVVVTAIAWRDLVERGVFLTLWVRAIAAGGMGYMANAVFAMFYHKPRPFAVLPVDSLIGAPFTAKSFPSDHATFAFAIAMVLAFAYPKKAWLVFLVATTIAVGRVYVGVHWPSDILMGAIVGSGWGALITVFDKKTQNGITAPVVRYFRKFN